MSSCGLLFQWASTIKIQLSSMHVGLVQNVHHHLIHCDLVLPYDISKKMLILALKKQSLTVCNIYLLSVWFRTKQFLLLLLNDRCLEEKQQTREFKPESLDGSVNKIQIVISVKPVLTKLPCAKRTSSSYPLWFGFAIWYL
jgi:hypothetical protein